MGRLQRFSAAAFGLAALTFTPGVISAEVSISGRVLDSHGRGIAGARVRAYPQVGEPTWNLSSLDQSRRAIASPEQISGADGAYRITSLYKKLYAVVAIASGYSPGEEESVFAPQAGVDLNLRAGSRLTGMVLGPRGTPIEGAEVRAYTHRESSDVFTIIETRSRPPLDSVTTGPGGQFRFETLGAGVYNFAVAAKECQESRYLKIRLREGENSPQKFELRAGARISGKVLSPAGQPVSGARVRATRTGDTERSENTFIKPNEVSISTDERGKFSFDTLEPGKYTLLVWHRDHATERLREVETGTESLSFTLPIGGAISGGVTDAGTGKPIAGARISVSDLQDLWKESVTDSVGTYAIKGLNSSIQSKRVMNIQADGYTSQNGVPVFVDARNENFALQPTASVHGRVVDRGLRGIPGARVALSRRQPRYPHAISSDREVADQEGSFRFMDVDPGTENAIRVSADGYLDSASEPFQFQPGEILTFPDITLTLGGAIEGAVVGIDGKGIGGAEISIRNVRCALSDAKGAFIVRGLPTGAVDLEARLPRFMRSEVRDVQVTEEQVTRGVRIVLEKGGHVKGSVKDMENRPVVGARVIAYDISTAGLLELSEETDQDGIFLLEGMRSRVTVELSVKHPGFLDFNDERILVNADDLKVVLRKRN